jgi:hypothetical protein
VRVEIGVDGIFPSAEVEVTRAHSGKKNQKDPNGVKTTATCYIRSAYKLCLLEAYNPEDVFRTVKTGPAM